MALTYKTPSEVSEEYLLQLKTLKPQVNTDQTDSDWYIRSRVIGGLLSGVYGDQKRIADDAFPQSARHEALERHLNTYFGEGFEDAQPSEGDVLVSGATGTLVPAGTEFLYSPNGNTYQSTDDVTLTATTGLVPVQSVNSGQDQNLLEGATLQISSPPAGLNSTATVHGGDLANGRNAESDEEAAQRILDRIRFPIAGGTATDYAQYARDADPSVTSVKVVRYIYGLGTVGVYITAGTTDIDAAIDNGQAIVRIPSDDLVETVEEYISAVNPITDCVHVNKPNEVTQDVTVHVRYKAGFAGSQILAGQTLTLDELVEREVNRALYRIPIGGTVIGATGFVVASEIEEAIDAKLSAAPFTEGTLFQVLVDRQVQDLAATGVNRMLRGDEIVKPGTVTIVEL